MTKDLTRGKPLKLIWEFTLPVFFGYVFQQLYTVVDTVIVGKSLGVDALAAVGSTGSVNFLIIGFCVGISTGFAIPVAQRFGARDYTSMRKVFFNSQILSIVFAVIITTVTVMFSRPLLVAMRTPADILDRAVTYITILFWGIPFIILFNLVSSVLRAVGDSKTPLYFLVLSSMLNIVLDLIFILGFHLDVAGAALATISSQAIAGALCWVYLRKKFEILRIHPDDRQLSLAHWGKLCSMGVPMGLQYTITALGVVVLQVPVNGLGSGIVGAVSAAQRLQLFFTTPFDALGTTMANYGGQHVGAGKLDRLKSGVLSSSFIGVVYSMISFAVMFFFGRQMGMMFLDVPDPEILHNIWLYLVWNGAFFIFLTLVNIIRFTIQGMGFSGFAIFAGIFEMIARGGIGLYAVGIWGYTAVCLASPAAWILADMFLIPAFFICLRRLRRPNLNSPVLGVDMAH